MIKCWGTCSEITCSLRWAPGFDDLVLTKGPYSLLLFWRTNTSLTGYLALGGEDDVACLDFLTLHAVDSLQSPSFKYHSFLFLDTTRRESPLFCSSYTRFFSYPPSPFSLSNINEDFLSSFSYPLSFWCVLWFSSLVMVGIIICGIIISLCHCLRQGSLGATNRNS